MCYENIIKCSTMIIKQWRRDQAHSTYTTFSEKLTFLTPWYEHVRVSEGREC